MLRSLVGSEMCIRDRIKGVGTDKGYQVATDAQQVYGGHGYIQEWGMEQYVRDARIAMIYEGTNGVQAMDLVGRKLAMNGGRAIQLFFKVVAEECAAAKGGPAADFAGRLENCLLYTSPSPRDS